MWRPGIPPVKRESAEFDERRLEPLCLRPAAGGTESVAVALGEGSDPTDDGRGREIPQEE